MKSNYIKTEISMDKNFMNLKRVFIVVLLSVVMLGMKISALAQTTTIFPSGSYIIDMGIVPQTIGNALKPYGLVYHLTMEHGVPISWIINPLKAKDGIDFTDNGHVFRGGPFIIPAQYRSADVNTEIHNWELLGVVGYTSTVPDTLPVFKVLTISNAPRWTMDKQNGALAVPYFNNAGIPASAYGGSDINLWKNPADLTGCDDIFVMPHADPTWATHNHLYDWNLTTHGAIWLGCHAGSALEDMFNPANPSQQTNFLTEKTGPAVLPGVSPGPYYQNALVLWSNHSNGTPPYSYDNGGDPVMQFMGTPDEALENGSEQIYVPTSAGWRPTTVVGGFDPDHPNIYNHSSLYKYKAAVIAYGRAFGDNNRGMVMLEAAHQFVKVTGPASVAAQRAFFNFALISAKTTGPDPIFNVSFGAVSSADTVPFSFTVSPPRNISEFNIAWSSTCGGTFIPGNTQSVNYVAPQVTNPTYCTITITLTEKSSCGKIYKNSTAELVSCALQVATTVAPACNGVTNGSITMVITGGPAPYVWSWTKSGGGSGSGSGTVISGLAPGTYTVVVTASNGTGCAKTFTVAVGENPVITVTPSSTNLTCNLGGNGSITLDVSGGTPGYSYHWADGPTTQNRNNLAASTYNVTVTDSKGCTKTASNITLTQPNAIVITPTVTDVLCNGNATGAISLSVSGGTGPYTYVWNDGPTVKDRTGLAIGTYDVTVTDASFCSQVHSGITVSQGTTITASASAGTISCYGASTTLTVTADGGTGILHYSLNGGEYQTSNTFTVYASSSDYNITVKDDSNCTKTTSTNVSQPTALVLSTVVTDETCPGDNDGAINLTAGGGTPGYTFDWADIAGPSNTEDRPGISANSYSVTVTDANNCTANSTSVVHTLHSDPVQPTNINH